jgi:hypothetical protein
MNGNIGIVQPNKPRMALVLLLVVGASLFGGKAARADSIDGTWCHDKEARTMTIEGSKLIIDRFVSVGQYSRHSFAADWPNPSPQDPDAGSRVMMRLMGEMNLTYVKVRPNGETTPPEYWHRCQPAT